MKPPPSIFLASLVQVLFFGLNLFALHLLLRGHHLPGGGFIGGLVTAISLVLLQLALGWEAVSVWLRVDAAKLAIVGLALSVGMALAPMVAGHPPMEQFHGHLRLPWIGELHLGTPLVFDAGVYLVVVGIAVKMIETLGRAAEGLSPLAEDERERFTSVAERSVVGSDGDGDGDGEAGGKTGKEEGHAG